jgi:glycosyltransferase involved in cell wall biosynthesis
MKILVVVDSHFKEYGGPYTAINQKIKFLNSIGVKNKLLFQRTDNFKYNLDLNYIINDFDIVHIYGLWKPFLFKVFYIAKKLKKKIIISPIGGLEPWALEQKKIKKKIAWWLYQKKIMNTADIVHVTSSLEEKNVMEKKIYSKIKIIGHGINLIDGYKLNCKKNAIKKIIFFSRIHKKKGILELVDAWSKINNKKNWILEIYGPISEVSYLKKINKKIFDLKLGGSIFVKNAVFSTLEKEKIFTRADGFILPSRSENFGISIGEALAYGLPVLTTNNTPWKIINENKAGLVFDFSVLNICLNLEKFINLTDEQRYEMGLMSIKLIKDNFLSQKIFNQYQKMYKDLANESFIYN